MEMGSCTTVPRMDISVSLPSTFNFQAASNCKKQQSWKSSAPPCPILRR
jgi:hypothetical protein